MHRIQQWPCLFAAHFLPHFRRPSANLLFDRIQGGNAFHRLDGDRRLVRLDQVIKLAANMRHARSFLNGSVLIELVKPGEGIGLQDTLKGGQMLLRMFSSAVGRVCEPGCRHIQRSRGAIIANVGPETPRLGLAVAGSKYGDGRIVSMQLVGGHHIAPQCFDQRELVTGCYRLPTWPA